MLLWDSSSWGLAVTLHPYTDDEYSQFQKAYVDFITGAIRQDPPRDISIRWKGTGFDNLRTTFTQEWQVVAGPYKGVKGFTSSFHSAGPDLITLYIDINRNKRLDPKDQEIFSEVTVRYNTDDFSRKAGIGKGVLQIKLDKKRGGEGSGREFPRLQYLGSGYSPQFSQSNRPVSAWYGIQAAMIEALGLAENPWGY